MLSKFSLGIIWEAWSGQSVWIERVKIFFSVCLSTWLQKYFFQMWSIHWLDTKECKSFLEKSWNSFSFASSTQKKIHFLIFLWNPQNFWNNKIQGSKQYLCFCEILNHLLFSFILSFWHCPSKTVFNTGFCVYPCFSSLVSWVQTQCHQKMIVLTIERFLCIPCGCPSGAVSCLVPFHLGAQILNLIFWCLNLDILFPPNPTGCHKGSQWQNTTAKVRFGWIGSEIATE